MHPATLYQRLSPVTGTRSQLETSRVKAMCQCKHSLEFTGCASHNMVADWRLTKVTVTLTTQDSEVSPHNRCIIHLKVKKKMLFSYSGTPPFEGYSSANYCRQHWQIDLSTLSDLPFHMVVKGILLSFKQKHLLCLDISLF